MLYCSKTANYHNGLVGFYMKKKICLLTLMPTNGKMLTEEVKTKDVLDWYNNI